MTAECSGANNVPGISQKVSTKISILTTEQRQQADFLKKEIAEHF